MSTKLSHERVNARKAGAHRYDNSTLGVVPARLLMDQERVALIATCESMLKLLDKMVPSTAVDQHRAYVQRQLNYMQLGGGRYITRHQGEVLKRMYGLFGSYLEKGIPLTEFDASKRKPQAWAKKPIAAFLTNPALLPKEPPRRT